MYLRGKGVSQDDTKAAAWFRKAAEQGHTRAQYNLAILYHIGIGVRRSDAQAKKWFRKAAEQGHGDAKISLVYMQENGGRLATKTPPAPDGDDLLIQSIAEDIGLDVASISPPAPVSRNRRVQSDIGEHGQDVAIKPPTAPTGRHLGVPVIARNNPHDAMPKSTATSRRGEFRVQLGSVKLKSRALEEAGRLNRMHKLVLGDLKVVPVRANLGKRGVFYRLRAGPIINRASAKSLCRKLLTQKQGCLVTKR
jgi:TPR repeat protein